EGERKRKEASEKEKSGGRGGRKEKRRRVRQEAKVTKRGVGRGERGDEEGGLVERWRRRSKEGRRGGEKSEGERGGGR
ncbi:hypothetical protein, partial [Escherichia coli]|uniref:hypothetical protein n=1 Tax=Escherichia coli TaxID=562 RepID=UPI003D77D8CB